MYGSCGIFAILLTFVGPVYPNAYEDHMDIKRGFSVGFPGPDIRGSELMKEKRGFPGGQGVRGSGFFDFKRNGLDEAMALLTNDEYAKSTLRNGLNVRRAEYVSERKQPVFTWPDDAADEVDDLSLDMTHQRNSPAAVAATGLKRKFTPQRGIMSLKRDAAKRNFGDTPRGMLTLKRDEYHSNQDYRADKRDKFEPARGELSWKRQSDSDILPDSLHYVNDDDPRLY